MLVRPFLNEYQETADSGTDHIELSMGERGSLQVESSNLECLALSFVYGYGKAEPDGELQPRELEWKISEDEWNSWNEHPHPCCFQ